MDEAIHILPFSAELGGLIILLIGLLLVSAFVSGSEAAFFSLGHRDVDQLRENNSRAANVALSLLGNQDYLLSTILILNNLVNVAAAIVAGTMIDKIVDFGTHGTLEFIVKTVVVTFALLLFGEIMPKLISMSAPRRYVMFCSVPIDILRKTFRPLSYLLISSSTHIGDVVSKKKGNLSIDELSDALEIADEHQTAEDKRILTGIIRFVNTEVTDVMRNRVEVVAVPIDYTLEQLRDTVIRCGFSRIPVYEEDLDNVKGILYVKDLIASLDRPDLEWQTLIRDAYFVPEHKMINDLLEEFQSKQIHLAVVVDEYGSTQGIISLEDILEEIVGEIADESDADDTFYTRIDSDTYIFEGRTHISDFLRLFDLDESFLAPYEGEAESLAGLMLEIRREFLKIGDKITITPFTFEVTQVTEHRIDKIKVKRS